jgi:hypothetical protein
VLGVPVQSQALNGMDSLLSIVQMPAGVPVATFAIGKAGAINAAAPACWRSRTKGGRRAGGVSGRADRESAFETGSAQGMSACAEGQPCSSPIEMAA